jgi:hypothetical protein
VWPKRTDNPFTPVLNASQRYVVSTTPEEPLPWENSTLLRGDAVDAVAELKAKLDQDLMILGSGHLVRSLMESHLIDGYQAPDPSARARHGSAAVRRRWPARGSGARRKHVHRDGSCDRDVPVGEESILRSGRFVREGLG